MSAYDRFNAALNPQAHETAGFDDHVVRPESWGMPDQPAERTPAEEGLDFYHRRIRALGGPGVHSEVAYADRPPSSVREQGASSFAPMEAPRPVAVPGAQAEQYAYVPPQQNMPVPVESGFTPWQPPEASVTQSAPAPEVAPYTPPARESVVPVAPESTPYIPPTQTGGAESAAPTTYFIPPPAR